jgi:hypothetical protein
VALQQQKQYRKSGDTFWLDMPEEVSLRSFIEKLLAHSATKDASKKCRQMKLFAKPVPGYACVSLTR